MRKLIYTATLLCLMCGCSTYKRFKTPETPQLEKVCGDSVQTQDSSAAILSWQEMFVDEPLQQLIRKGITSNTDLQIARLNLDQAEALLVSSKLAYLPSFALTPNGSIAKVDGAKATHTYNIPLTTQWELDLFGKLRNSKEQARSSVMQSQQYIKMVQTQIVSSIANVYYTLILLDEQLAITEESVKNQKANLDVIIAMKEAGMQTETAVNQATANYYSVQSSAKDLEKQIRLIENSMAILINETPQTISRNSMSKVADVRMDHNAAIPLNALANRPDVRDAEFALSRSFYGVNVARSAFYPSISLSGSAGWTNNLGEIVNPGKMLLSALGSLTQPLFNRGVNRANLKIAKSQYEQSLLTFEKSLLLAGSEVNDALVACQNSAAKKILRKKQVEASESAFLNSSELMKYSSTTYLEVLIAQSSLLQSQLIQASDWFEGIQGKINLYKALGGGVE